MRLIMLKNSPKTAYKLWDVQDIINYTQKKSRNH
jgi:hypothetical protein